MLYPMAVILIFIHIASDPGKGKQNDAGKGLYLIIFEILWSVRARLHMCTLKKRREKCGNLSTNKSSLPFGMHDERL